MNNKEEQIKKLTSLQYEVTQNNVTGRPFAGEYNDHYEARLYVDIVSGEPPLMTLSQLEMITYAMLDFGKRCGVGT